MTWLLLKRFVPEMFLPESLSRSPATFIAGLGGAVGALLTLVFWSWWEGVRKDNSTHR